MLCVKAATPPRSGSKRGKRFVSEAGRTGTNSVTSFHTTHGDLALWARTSSVSTSGISQARDWCRLLSLSASSFFCSDQCGRSGVMAGLRTPAARQNRGTSWRGGWRGAVGGVPVAGGRMWGGSRWQKHSQHPLAALSPFQAANILLREHSIGVFVEPKKKSFGEHS